MAQQRLSLAWLESWGCCTRPLAPKQPKADLEKRIVLQEEATGQKKVLKQKSE